MLVALLVCVSSVSMAQRRGGSSGGVKLGLSLLKFDSETEGTSFGDNKRENLYTDIKLGYLTGTWYFGGILSNYSQKVNSTEMKRNLLGATVGYHNSGYFIDLSYFLSGELDSNGLAKATKGSGLGVDFGYNAPITSSFFLGLQMSYKSISYGEIESGGVSVSQTNKEKSELYPMINLGFVF